MIRPSGIIRCRDKKLIYGTHTICMGILNVTPDSFSDGGKHVDIDEALAAVEQMIEDGAEIIDVGGESTKPGYIEVPEDEELNRIAPVIARISSEFDALISVDTYKSKVAEGALKEGAHIINDITGLMADPNMAGVIKAYDAACVLMFNARTNGEEAGDIIGRASKELQLSVDMAIEAGISEDQIILDPGVGFGTTREQDMELIKSINELSLGKYPVLLGVSRKRVIRELMARDSAPVDRDVASAAVALCGVTKGASIIRAHNVRATVDAMRCCDSLLMGE